MRRGARRIIVALIVGFWIGAFVGDGLRLNHPDWTRGLLLAALTSGLMCILNISIFKKIDQREGPYA